MGEGPGLHGQLKLEFDDLVSLMLTSPSMLDRWYHGG
jgi:hypothetical protein